MAHKVNAYDGTAAQAGLHAAQHVQIPLQVVVAGQRHQKPYGHTELRFYRR